MSSEEKQAEIDKYEKLSAEEQREYAEKKRREKTLKTLGDFKHGGEYSKSFKDRYLIFSWIALSSCLSLFTKAGLIYVHTRSIVEGKFGKICPFATK